MSKPTEEQNVPISGAVADASSSPKNQLRSRAGKVFEVPSHGRYGYSAIVNRPDFNWPDGKRLAVYIGLNLEHFTFGDGLGAELCPGGAASGCSELCLARLRQSGWCLAADRSFRRVVAARVSAREQQHLPLLPGSDGCFSEARIRGGRSWADKFRAAGNIARSGRAATDRRVHCGDI